MVLLSNFHASNLQFYQLRDRHGFPKKEPPTTVSSCCLSCLIQASGSVMGPPYPFVTLDIRTPPFMQPSLFMILIHLLNRLATSAKNHKGAEKTILK